MIGADVRQWRTERGWSQHKLAVALGVTVTAVARWESGARKPAPFLHLALLALHLAPQQFAPAWSRFVDTDAYVEFVLAKAQPTYGDIVAAIAKLHFEGVLHDDPRIVRLEAMKNVTAQHIGMLNGWTEALA